MKDAQSLQSARAAGRRREALAHVGARRDRREAGAGDAGGDLGRQDQRPPGSDRSRQREEGALGDRAARADRRRRRERRRHARRTGLGEWDQRRERRPRLRRRPPRSSSAGSSSASSGSSSSFVTLTGLEGMQVSAGFAETDAAKIRPGQAATVTVDALPDVQFSAHVLTVAGTATSSSNVVTYEVTFALDSRNAQLKPGMTANVDVVTGEADNVLHVPTGCGPGKRRKRDGHRAAERTAGQRLRSSSGFRETPRPRSSAEGFGRAIRWCCRR